MNTVLLTKKIVRKNKALKVAQKRAKKYYGRTRGLAPKAKINKVVNVTEKKFVSMTEDSSVEISKPETISVESLIEYLRKNSLTGLSGDGYQIADKIETYASAKAEKHYLLVNAVECDPALIHDSWILMNRLDEVKKGIDILTQCFGFDRVVVATKEPISQTDNQVEFVQVPNRYPMGFEKILSESVLGIPIAADEYPTQKGILVLNVQTVLEIGAIMNGESTFSGRYLTAADLTNGTAVVVKAPFGMEAREVLKKAFPNGQNVEIFVGQGVMNSHKAEENETVTGCTNLIAYALQPDYSTASNCKGCGACVSNCPMGVKVGKIAQAVDRGQKDGFDQWNPKACIGCGTCTYVCHAGKNLLALVAKINEM